MRKLSIQLVISLSLFIFSCAQANAAVSMFYQPLLADMAIDKSVWTAAFKKLRRDGIDTLILQWSLHDDAFSNEEQSTWLEARVKEAIDADLNIIVGLSADSDSFKRLEQPTAALPAYFRKIREKDRELVRKWITIIPDNRLSGWYLALEIDDLRWRQKAAKDVLLDYLQHTTDEITSIDTHTRPIIVSSFFTGQMSPQQYAAFTREIHEASGIDVWVQDGAGVNKLTQGERTIYINEMIRCHSGKAPTIQGLIFELFKEIKNNKKSFTSVPLAKSSLDKRLSERAACGIDTSYFGLNYIFPTFNP